MASPTVGKDSAGGAAVKASAGTAVQADGHWVEYDQFVDQQIRKTRSQVKGTELAVAAMTLAAGTLGYFLLAALADHWLFAHGFGFWGRLLALVVYLAGAGYFVYRRVLPLVILRINPIYAAETIERSRPSLKNTLMNFLFLRGEREHVSPAVYKAIEQQAATNLSRVSLETAVDRTRLVHVLYVLLAAVALFAAYCLFSPKNPWDTVGRVVMPWAKIDAPSRVTIADVRPGDKLFYRGEPVEVSAEISGLRADETVQVFYSTADHQTVDNPAPMFLARDGVRHAVRLPAGEGGLQQDVDYRIEAGDAISPTYHLQSAIAPTIAVESIDYEYPSYTRRERKTVKDTGDIQALEGTRVTIHGRANQPLQAANLELEGDGGIVKQPARIDGQAVAVTFTLALSANDRSRPQYAHYRLRPENREQPQPVQYRIDVIPDLPPEIKFLAPQEEAVDLPSNSRLTLELRAVDPDFALSDVTLKAKSGQHSVIEKRLLPEKYEGGPLNARFVFDPRQLGLQEGEQIEYWATARDNRTPEPNETTTPVRQIHIVSADHRRGQPETVAQNDPGNGGKPNAGEQNPPNQDPNNQNPNGQNPQPNQGEQRQNNPADSNANRDPHSKSGETASEKQRPEGQKPDHPEERDPNRKPEQNSAGKKPQDNPQPQQKPDNAKDQKGDGASEKPQPGGGDKGNPQSNKSDQNNPSGKSGSQGNGSDPSQGQSDSNQQNSSNSQPSGNPSGGGNAGQPGQSDSTPGKSGQENSQPSGQNGSPKSDNNQPSAGQKGTDQKTGANQTKPDGSPAGQPPDNSAGSGASKPSSGGEPNHSDQQPVPANGSNDKEALKRVVQYQQQHSPENTPSQSQPGQQNNNEQKPGESANPQQQPGNPQQPGQQASPQQPNPQSNQQQPAGSKGQSSPPANPLGMKNQTGDNGAGQKPSDNSNPQSNQSQPGNSGAPGSANNQQSNQSGGQPSGKLPGNPPRPDKSTDNKPDANQPIGVKPTDQQPNGQPPNGEKPPGDNANGKNTSGQKPAGEKRNDATANSQKPNGDSPASTAGQASRGTQSGANPQPPATSLQSPVPSPQAQQPGAKPDDHNPAPGNGVGEGGADKHNDGPQTPSGKGDKTNEGSNPTGKKPDKAQSKPEHPDAQGGDSESPKGNPGDGKSSKTDDKGSPASQGDAAKPVKENKQSSNGPQRENKSGAADDKASSPSNSPQESNLKSEEKGDRSGGGGKGGGQPSNQPGTGGPGQTTAADEGTGHAEGQGKGDTSSKPGGKKSEKPTGQSGSEQGDGATSKAANPNDPQAKPGGKQSPTQQSQPDKASQPGSPQDNDATAQGSGSPSGIPHGGSQAGPPPTDVDYHGVKTGTEANLDYARKQFELALDHLKKGNPDLLRELHWTADDARRLAERLEQMQKNARLPGPQGDDARLELQDMLRSLGQRSGVLSRRGDHSLDDAQRGLRESHDGGPPSEYIEQFNAFQDGAARGGK